MAKNKSGDHGGRGIRKSVYIPAELARMLDERDWNINLSRLLRTALQQALEHGEEDGGTPVDEVHVDTVGSLSKAFDEADEERRALRQMLAGIAKRAGRFTNMVVVDLESATGYELLSVWRHIATKLKMLDDDDIILLNQLAEKLQPSQKQPSKPKCGYCGKRGHSRIECPEAKAADSPELVEAVESILDKPNKRKVLREIKRLDKRLESGDPNAVEQAWCEGCMADLADTQCEECESPLCWTCWAGGIEHDGDPIKLCPTCAVKKLAKDRSATSFKSS